MESSPSALLKILVPKVPFILKTAAFHTLNLSETSSKWDLRTELTVNVLRKMLGPGAKPSSITKQQRMTIKDPGVKGKVWASKIKCTVPEEDDVRQLVFRAIEEMGTGEEKWWRPESIPLEAEWNGYRPGVADNEPEPADLDEKEKYEKLMGEVTSKVTVLYFHGGAMYLLDPATYRPTTSRIAKETGGRVFSVRYRLSPQNPFPAALLDAFTAYLTLLYPPADAPHAPVPASDIVFAGDSAGGLLSASLLQLLLQIHRQNPTKDTLPTVSFHGKTVEIPLPAGTALVSPWLDVTRSLPSVEALAKYDYLPPPSHTANMKYPPCDAWPANPPRADLYCEASAMLHPIVSPLAARDWKNSPPVFFSLGEEMLRDEDAFLAQRLLSQGVKVVYREFEAMPHVFAYMLEYHPASSVHFSEFAEFCKGVVEGGVESSVLNLKAKTLERREVQPADLIKLTDEEVDELMRKARDRRDKKVDGSVDARPML
ncbi:alpha/beta hydrolase fold-domain-containing protein [Lophiotrema nucula]|uniref:Alpha/beta hydrolase fold-domain-containing protein n=1 Tax=Lophiotrema nucula TaxID=690887 RepID=A0A6A5YXZ6_9PLEO|nr:alpha/beta hydrolase fold-domain-containing protein [Lophiotrema nucula]